MLITLEIQAKIIDLDAYMEPLNIEKDYQLDDVGEIHVIETRSSSY